LVEKPEAKENFGNTGIDGSIILVWILRKQSVKAWTGFIWHRVGSKIKTLDSIKARNLTI